MKQTFFLRFLAVIMLSLFMFSCASRKDMIYYQNVDSVLQNSTSGNYELKLQPDDILRIVVMGENPESVAPFNKYSTVSNKEIDVKGQDSDTYLIDGTGHILFPVIGKIKLAGLTKSQVETELKSRLREYVTSPSVSVTLMNFKVTVQGEVVKPGIVAVASERLTLPEALSMSGDLTIFGKRNNIMIVRESNGKRTVERVDITKADFVNSPYYYLAQNDLIYVEPNKTKMNTSKFDPNIGVVISAASLLATIIVLLTN